MTKQSAIYLGAGILIGLFIANLKCEGDTGIVTVPEKKGSFEVLKPEHKPVDDLSKNDKSENVKWRTIVKDNSSLIDSLLAENAQLKADFAKAPDTVKIPMYADAIKLNLFEETFDDDLVSITAKGVVRGEVKGLMLDYTIKEQKVAVKRPWRVLGSAEIGSTKFIDKVVAKGGLMVQSRKGFIYSASIDTDEVIYIGTAFPIFTSR